jgi:hypothetical protein
VGQLTPGERAPLFRLVDNNGVPQLLWSDAPGVVSLSSLIRQYGHIDPSDLMSDRRYSPVSSYSRCKLAMLIFAQEPSSDPTGITGTCCQSLRIRASCGPI